jgi:hypothetical protein
MRCTLPRSLSSRGSQLAGPGGVAARQRARVPAARLRRLAPCAAAGVQKVNAEQVSGAGNPVCLPPAVAPSRGDACVARWGTCRCSQKAVCPGPNDAPPRAPSMRLSWSKPSRSGTDPSSSTSTPPGASTPGLGRRSRRVVGKQKEGWRRRCVALLTTRVPVRVAVQPPLVWTTAARKLHLCDVGAHVRVPLPGGVVPRGARVPGVGRASCWPRSSSKWLLTWGTGAEPMRGGCATMALPRAC